MNWRNHQQTIQGCRQSIHSLIHSANLLARAVYQFLFINSTKTYTYYVSGVGQT